MKRNFLLLFLLLFIGITSSAQNWKPFYKGDTVNYRFGNGAEYFINTLWVDSAKVINGDSVFYMNRIVTDCDTCIHLSSCDTCYAINNQPQFLMRYIVKKPNNYFQLKDTVTYNIKINAHLNESWKFDSIHNIMAIVTSVGTENILSQTDSVKTISLSNGHIIKLSKRFGIISFPDLKESGIDNILIGIENRNFGYRVPNYLDYYNFTIGEMLIYDGYIGVPGGWKDYTIYKTITSKTLFQNKIQFNYNYFESYLIFPGGYGTATGTGCFEIPNTNYSNLRNNQLTIEETDYSCQNGMNYYAKVVVTNLRKYVAELYYYNYIMPVVFVKPSQGQSGSNYYSITKLNGGEFDHQDYGFEYGLNYHLIKYSPVGLKPELPLISNLSVSPNPCNGLVTFMVSKEFADKGYTIEIYDLQGRMLIIQEHLKNSETTINLSNLLNGLYLYRVFNNNRKYLFTGKIFLQ